MTTQNTAKNAIVFSGRNGLDLHDVRTGVLRIPEVTVRIRQAQSIFDQMGFERVDLFNITASDDENFFRNIKLKSLVAAVVQVGLFDRFLKTQRRPDFMIGNTNGDSAVLVCAGLQTFEELVCKSAALDTLRNPVERVVIPFAGEPAPLLSGISLAEYRALRMGTSDAGLVRYEFLGDAAMDLRKITSQIHQNQNVNRFVQIGPVGGALTGQDQNVESEDIESLDSIELDPMLGWFWRSMRGLQVAHS